ncbi:MAG: STAS domain-containing protein [Pseudomonadota bacterium]|nr:MAG: STAS domain-containing protein [Pseudomonadota bacterium]
MALKLNRHEEEGIQVLRVSGEVDLYSSPELRIAVQTLLDRAKDRVHIDLSGVAYMDSSGVATLVEGMRNARACDVAFVLYAPSESVMKVLTLSRLDSVFDIIETG